MPIPNSSFLAAIPGCSKYTSGNNVNLDYYWRPYDGETIPTDALVSHHDRDVPAYIGTVPIRPYGLMVGEIQGGSETITVTTYSVTDQDVDAVHTKHKFINILCTQHPDKFEWVKSQYNQELQEFSGQFVVGGYEFNIDNGQSRALHVGRAKSVRDGRLIIGKACPSPTRFGHMYYHLNRQEMRSDNYETLIYRNNLYNHNDNRADTVYGRSDEEADSDSY